MKNKLLRYVLYAIVRLLNASYRFRYTGLENYETAKKLHPKGTFCLGCWHENIFANILGQRGYPYCIMVSRSQDGEYVDFFSRKLGYQTARGSSSRGGKEARQTLEEKMAEGLSAAFAVDGPRGPRHRCKYGVMITAANTGAAVLPVAAISKKPWIITKAWDQTRIPKPFSKIIYHFGPPVFIPQDVKREDYRKEIKRIETAIHATEKMARRNLEHWAEASKRMPKLKPS